MQKSQLKKLKVSELDFEQIFSRVNARDRAFFFRQLATMLVSGLPIAQALTIIATQTKKKNFRNIINNIIENIESGIAFSTAIAVHPKVFSKFEISICRAGEASGKLNDVMEQLAKSLEAELSFSGKIKSAMFYPAFILVAMIVVVYIMMTRVLPNLTTIFTDSNVELPWTTKILISVSNAMISYGWLIGLLLVGFFVGAKLYLGTPEGSLIYSNITLQMPIFGKLNQKVFMARFSRTMALLTDAGVPIVESIQICASVMSNRLYARSLMKAARDVEKGIPFSVPISKDSFFDPIVSQMILVGEQTGKIDDVLFKVANYFEEDVETELKGLVSLVEPALLIVIGLGVAFIVFSVIMPIYTLTTSIQ